MPDRPPLMVGRRRPTVLVDMDGPLADFDGHFYALCAEQGWPVNAERHEQTARYATDHVIDDEHRRLAREVIDTSRWFSELPVVDGAVDGMERLREVADVWIVTKPLEVNPTCRDDKALWLSEHFDEYWLRRLIIAPDKSIVRGDILLDDAPKVEWFPHATWEPVIYDFPYNREGTPWAGLRHWTWSEPLDHLWGKYE